MEGLVRLLIAHPLVVRRDERAGLHVEVRLTGEGRAAAGVVARRPQQRSEALAERDLPFVGHVEAAEQQQRMLVQRGADPGEGRVVDGLGHVNADDLHAV